MSLNTAASCVLMTHPVILLMFLLAFLLAVLGLALLGAALFAYFRWRFARVGR